VSRRTLVLAALLAVAANATRPARAEVQVRWLGVAGFTLTSGETTIAHDPYLSRPGLLRTVFRSYVPDEGVLGGFIGAGSRAPELARTSVYLVGHSHFDHLGDVPWLAARTDGRVVGSATTAAIARGYGLAGDRVVIAAPGETIDAGDFEVRVFASEHSKVLAGSVPFPGEITEPPEAPIHAFSFRLGDARGYLVSERSSGLRIALLSSAGRDVAALEELGRAVRPVDLLLPATLGRDGEYARDLVRTLRPRLVVPHHFENLFTSIDDPDAAAPADEAGLAAFEQELRAAAAAEGLPIDVRRPVLFEAITLHR
jgi:L-ascorbate metabolism protein UlaG (beta-lactamase superfamily)